MYTSAELIDKSRKYTGCSTNELGDSVLLEAFNDGYFDMYLKIINLDKNFFRGKRITDLTSTTLEYSLQEADTDTSTFGMQTVERVSIKYSDTLVEAEKRDFDEFRGNTMDSYSTGQSTLSPFFIRVGGDGDARYIRIYPTPTEDVSGGLVYEGIKRPFKATLTSLSEHILIPDLYKRLLVDYMNMEIYRRREQIDKKNDARAEYDRGVKEMLSELSKDSQTFVESKGSDLSHFH